MKITNYIFLQNNNIQKKPISSPLSKNTSSVLKPLAFDTVSFGNSDFLSQSKPTILRTLRNSVSPENFIGGGGEANVYKIDGTEYCFRQVYLDDGEKIDKINFRLNEQDRINHVVAKVGNNGSSIMKYIQGVPVATALMPLEKQREVSQIIENMPIEAYNNLLKQICHAYENDMMFDCNSGNIIVNPENKTLTAIDFYKMEEPEILRPLSYIYESLKNESTTDKQKRIIIGKTLLASINEFEQNKKPCLNLDNFDFQQIANKLFDDKKLVENTNYKKTFLQVFSNLKNEKIKELRNPKNNNNLKGQLKLAKALVKQLLLDNN